MAAQTGPPTEVALPRAVDRLTVQVLVDNVSDQLSTNPDHVLSERECLLQAGMREWSGEAICCAHFGLSLLLTVFSNGTRHTVLFDGGPEGYAVERNGGRLGVDFGTVEAVVLSHGHWDHAGGLLKAMGLIQSANGGRPIPCHMHPGMFRKRALKFPTGDLLPFKDVPGIAELKEHGADVICSTEPRLVLDDTFYVSGEIPRVTPSEQGLPNHMRRTEDGSDWEPDPLIMDERFLAVHVRDKGVVVFTACSHAGVINVLTEARNAFSDLPVCAVMGGLHLSGPGPEKIIPETVSDLAGFGLRWIIPCHCTGWRAVTALVNAFGADVVVPGAVGKQFTF
jgi:7,8-dihydropterin-6-yl-methyl-4-(beta-D-ribofuranosyl)aminobenzene 5'-phosphate synthase